MCLLKINSLLYVLKFCIVIIFFMPLCSCCILNCQTNKSCAVSVSVSHNTTPPDLPCPEACCDSLTEALGYVQQYQYNYVAVSIQLHSSTVVLERGANNTINNPCVHRLSLESTNGSIVQCSREAGINFTGCGMIVQVKMITFVGCSSYGSLYFEHYHPHIEIVNVTVNMSTGIGLAFVNVSGNVVINNSNITNTHNSQNWFGPITGLNIWSQLSSSDHKLLFELNNCHFINNSAHPSNYVMTVQRVTKGGGMYINLKKTRNDNRIVINNCTFASNRACIGGGLSVRANTLNNTSVEIVNCNFYRNKANIGSAIDLFCVLSPIHTEDCSTKVKNSNFENNSPVTEIVQMFSSTVCTTNIHLLLDGYVLFSNNNGSAIAASETIVEVQENSTVSFIGNRAQRGGGLNLVSSFVTIEQNTRILFRNNSALVTGGAIFSNQRFDLYVPYSHDCFIRYVETEINPDDWNATLIFKENQALNGKAIFTTSVMPCLWKTNMTLAEDIDATFCRWKSWDFPNNCCEEIATSAKSFKNENYTLEMISGLPIHYHKFNLTVFDELGHNVTRHTTFTMIPAGNNELVVAPNYNGSIVAFGNGPRTEKWYIQNIGERTVTASMTITMHPCPPGFVYESSASDCICRKNLHSIVHCLPDRIALIETDYCLSYSTHDKDVIVYGRCIFAALNTGNPLPFVPLPRKVEKFCEALNRRGLLCGNCMKNYSLDVFSDSFRCVTCSSSVKSWFIFILVDSLPVFVLFSAVVMLHVSLTSGPVNGYIFSSQVITVTLEVIFIKASLEKAHAEYPDILTSILLIPCNVWSLDFFRIYKLFVDKPTCLGSGLKVMHILALRYLSAFYPLLFLIVTYILIELHARNCQCLVRLLRPICCFLSRFRRSWNIRTSVVDAFAAFILLSYVKIIRVSLLLTTYNTVYDITDSSVVKMVLHYDPTITYGSHEHVPFMIVGVILLLTYGLFLPLLLILYQFQFLQRSLDCLRLNRNGLRIFMDAFQGCYKDGKDNGPDRRYFAGLYFVFRLMVFGTFNLFWENKELYLTLQSLMIFFALITTILQPYKKAFYTVVDTFFFCVLAVVFGLHVYVFDKAETTLKIPGNAVYTSYALESIPFIYFICYMTVWLGKRVLKHHKYCNLSAYGPIERSISWRYNDSYSVMTYATMASNRGNTNERLSLTATQQSIAGEAQRTPLRDSASFYGSIN